jgi:hypothetical protein
MAANVYLVSSILRTGIEEASPQRQCTLIMHTGLRRATQRRARRTPLRWCTLRCNTCRSRCSPRTELSCRPSSGAWCRLRNGALWLANPKSERKCCLLILDSVTSTPQWIRQPKLHNVVHDVCVFVCKGVLGSPVASQPLNIQLCLSSTLAFSLRLMRV